MKNLFRKKNTITGSSPVERSSGIPAEILNEYRQYIGITEDTPLCKAPFISMRFNRSGGVTPCCQNYHLDSMAGKGLLEVWNGTAYKNLRKRILNNDLDGQCDFCKTHLLNRDYGNVLAANYNHFNIHSSAAPVYLDFSIDSRCNLQCVMCNASLSSSHTALEGQETLASIYNEEFFTALDRLIPDLEFAIFSGGEPLLIESYYRIWERMFAMNPKMGVVITTNATVLGTRAKSAIEQGRCAFNVSIDSLDPKVYESIRHPATFEKTFQNLQYLIDYTRRKNTALTLAACPMNMNWQTLSGLAAFCVKEDIQLYLNLVTKPYHVALWPLPEDELKRIAAQLRKGCAMWFGGSTKGVDEQIHILIHQIETWAQQSGFFKEHLSEYLVPALEFSNRIKAYVAQDAVYQQGNAVERARFDRNLDEVLQGFPMEFYTDFFLERICNIPAVKIFKEVCDEDTATTAGNLCSIYYYSRGELYSKQNQQ